MNAKRVQSVGRYVRSCSGSRRPIEDEVRGVHSRKRTALKRIGNTTRLPFSNRRTLPPDPLVDILQQRNHLVEVFNGWYATIENGAPPTRFGLTRLSRAFKG